MMALVMPETIGPRLDIAKSVLDSQGHGTWVTEATFFCIKIRCVMMSIVHDMAEADTGDIPPEHASGVTKEEKHELEVVRSARLSVTGLNVAHLTLLACRHQAAMDRIFRLLDHPSIQSLRVKSLWEEYEARETPEAKFVKDLDMFELAVQGVEYENCEQRVTRAVILDPEIALGRRC